MTPGFKPFTKTTLKQKRLKNDFCKCVMRNNALKNNEHANSISKDYNNCNFKCFRTLFKDITACLRCYICESFGTHYNFNQIVKNFYY